MSDQSFKREIMVVSFISVILPAIFSYLARGDFGSPEEMFVSYGELLVMLMISVVVVATFRKSLSSQTFYYGFVWAIGSFATIQIPPLIGS